MAQWTEDGACIPSWLAVTDAPHQGSMAEALNSTNTAVRVGYVVSVHYPLDKDYEKATEVTYDVATRSSIGSGASAWHLYTNVRLGVRLGGSINDFSRFRIRSPKAKYDASKGLTPEQIAECSAVMIECENGQSQNGIIVGFAEHPNLPPDDKLLGHYYRWDFNGMSSSINKDGEQRTTFTGAILDPNNNQYIAAPSDTTGTYTLFDKNGSWWANNVKGESLVLDKPGKRAKLTGRSITLQSLEGNVNVASKAKVDVQATSNAVFNGRKVFTGKEGSSNPHVKGHVLADALNKLVTILSNGPIGALGLAPVATHPVVVAQLQAWKAIYAQKSSPFLSRKAYVE